MLGKEDVLLWFKDLESYQRINLMYDLLNMCMPFEVRFLGSCVEEIGKHSYQELRGSSIEANDVERLAKDPAFQIGLLDENTRHRAAIYMSVMHARNCSCANWFYRTLFRTVDPVEHIVKVLTAKGELSTTVINELLLLYTIGLYHPAFTFEQKTYFRNGLFHVVEFFNIDVTATTIPDEEQEEIPVITVPPPPPSPKEPEEPVVVPPTQVKPGTALSLGDLPSHGIHKVQRFPSGPPEIRPFSTTKSNPSINKKDGSKPLNRSLSPLSQFAPLPAILSPSSMHLQPASQPPIVDGIIVPAPQLHLEPNLSGTVIPLTPLAEATSICADEENHFISEDKNELLPWPTEQVAKQNGMRFHKNFHPKQHELFINKKNEPDKAPVVHCSNSTSSSNSSRNHSPCETPPAVTPHGPGRGNVSAPQQLTQPPADSKPRVNGLPPQPPSFITPSCDSIPFGAVPSFSSFTPRYYQYRPPFPTNYPPINEVLYGYPPIYYSSPLPPRNPNCCNCGALGHTMVDCTSQSVEEITQTPYLLDFDSPTVPDNTPEK